MRPVCLALGWVCGIVLAANQPYPSSALALRWLALAALALLGAWLLRDWLRWPALALLAFTLGALRMTLAPHSSDIARFNNRGGVTIEGVVRSVPAARDRGVQLQLAADTLIRGGRREPVSGAVLVQALQANSIRQGDRVRATGLLQRPWESDDFSWKDHLARSNVFSVLRDSSLEVLAPGQRASLVSALRALNGRAGQFISRYLPAPQSALLKGILLGDESSLVPSLRNAFNVTGSAHVIAISGFNMIILSAAVMALLRRAQLPPARAAFIGILAILLYTIFVGDDAAVLRAALMSSLLVFASVLRRRVFAPASLSVAILLMSLESPRVLWDIGFQLSVFAILGIMLFVAPLTALLQRALDFALSPGAGRRVGNFLGEPLVISLAAQIATLPLILRYFGRLSPLSLPVNLLIVPAQAPLLILGFLATAAAFVAPLPAQLLFWLDLLPLTWTTEIVQTAARLPLASTELQVDPRLVAAFYLTLVTAALLQAFRHPRLDRALRALLRHATGSFALLLAIALSLLLLAARLSRPDGLLHLWLLDVGHGNAVLLQAPSGAHILIGGGRAPSRLFTALGERLPFHDRRIELLVPDALDPEATRAFDALLQRYKLGLLLHSGQSATLPQLSAAADQTLALRAGHSLDFADGLRIELLHPQPQPPAAGRPAGNAALVLRVRYGEVSFLLPSSLGREGQQTLLNAGVSPRATVLQLPQHGAARSLASAFLRATGAQLAIVHTDPDDPRNRAGDPHPDVLSLLGDIPLLRSDQSGALHFWSDGNRLWRDVLPLERAQA